MAASTREVFLLLKARDEASRVLRGFSSEVARSSNAMHAAALRAQATAAQGEVVARRQASALMSQTISEKLLRAAVNDKRVAQARATGATADQLRSLRLTSQQLREEANEIVQTQRAYDKKTSAIASTIRMMDREAASLEKADRDARRFSSALFQTSGALATVAVGLAGLAAAGGYFFYSAYQDWTEYSNAVALTKTQVDGFTTSLEELSDVGIRVATEIPVAFEEIQPALFNIFSSTNANIKQSEILLEGFAKAAVAGQTDILTAAKGTISIMNAYNIPLEKVNDVLDIQFELVRKGVGTYEEFASVFGRVVPSAARAGQSFETIAAMMAIMTRNGQSAAMASTSAARAMDAFSHPKAIAQLEKFGVKMRDAQGNMLPLVEILKDFRDALNKVPAPDRVAKIIEIFKGAGGTIQARRFIEQMLLRPGEIEEFEKMLQSMENATGAMGNAYSTMADTAAAKTQLMKNRWQALKITMGQAAAPAILMIIDALSSLLNWFNKLDPKTKEMITTVLLLSVGFTAIAAIVVGVIAGLLMLAAAIAAVTVEMLIIAGVAAGVGAGFAVLAASITLLWVKSEGFRNILIGWWTWLKKVKDEAWDPFAKGISDSWKQYMEPALTRLGEVIDTKVMPVIEELTKQWQDKALPVMKQVGETLNDQVKPAFEFIGKVIDEQLIPAIADATKYYHDHKAAIDPIIDAVLTVAKVIAFLVGGIIVLGVVVAAIATAGGIMLLLKAFKVIIWVIEKANIGFAATIDWLVNLYNSIKDNFGKGSAAVGEWIGKVVTWFQELPGKIWAGIQALPDVLKRAALAAFDAFFYYAAFIATKVIVFFTKDLPDGIAQGITWIKEKFVTGWNAITEWFSLLPGRIVLYAAAIYFGIVNWFSKTNTDVSNWVSKTVNDVIDWFKKLPGNIRDALVSAGQAIATWSASAGTWLWQTGKDMIQGLINGVSSMIGSIGDMAKRAADKFKEGVEDALGISSPSKVFAVIGKQSIQGYVQGVTESAKLVSRVWDSALIPNMSSSGFAPTSRVGAFSAPQSAFSEASKQNNVVVNVYTNEIDPRTQAAELGWELEGRLN